MINKPVIQIISRLEYVIGSKIVYENDYHIVLTRDFFKINGNVWYLYIIVNEGNI